MQKANVIQGSFTAGELAPELHQRVDLAKYHVGLKRCRNFIVQPTGGVMNRAGTEWVGEIRDSTKKARNISFTYNDVQSYNLVFEHLSIRVVRDGGLVTETPKVISGASQAFPVVIIATGHGYANGEDVYHDNIVGMTELNGLTYRIGNVTANTYELTGVDGTGFGAYVSGGTCARIYTIASPYVEADLPRLKYTQSADVMTITHPSYPVKNLTRSGHASWTLTDETFTPSQAFPTGVALTVATAGAVKVRYKVTAVNADGTEESLPGSSNSIVAITGITKANPAVVTTGANHNLVSGDEITMTTILGMLELNGFPFLVNVLSPTTYALRYLDNTNVDSTNYSAYTSGGNVYKLFERGLTAAMSAANYVDITWNTPLGAAKFNIYKEKNGLFGYLGSATVPPFRDDGSSVPDTSDTPPSYRNPFANGQNPACVEYHEQRRIYGNIPKKTNGLFTSQSANYSNMCVSDPTRADDAITKALVAKKVQDIRHLVSANVLLAFTGSAEFKIWAGGNEDVLTPANFSAKAQSQNGCSHVPPLVLNESILYIQALGSTVRDLHYELSNDNYTGTDISMLSSHFFKGYTIDGWAHSAEPMNVIWAVRSDGKMIGLTYVKDQEVYGWHLHETDGDIESVSVIPEGSAHVAYLIVRRVINGQVRRYIERMQSRYFSIIDDAWFVDCGLRYEGPATKTVSKLWHLEGKTVSILADGNVQPPQVVTGGKITLAHSAVKILVGLRYDAEMQTLRIDASNNGDSIQPKAKKIVALNIGYHDTRGLKVGVRDLHEVKERSVEGWGLPIQPITKLKRIIMDPLWDEVGEVTIRQEYPLPATILSVIPEMALGK